MAKKPKPLKVSDYTRSKAAYAALGRDVPVIVFDVETTGKSAKTDRITQFAALRFEKQGNKWLRTGELNAYINPERKLDKEIVELTGLTDEFLADKPKEPDVYSTIISFMQTGRIFVAYNARFDIGFIDELANRNMGKHFSPKTVIDPLLIARELIEASKLEDKSYKLVNVATYYQVAKDGFHNAFVDVENTWDVLLSEMADFELKMDSIEEDDVFSETALTSMFKITYVNRWKKTWGKRARVDRLYLSTTAGEVIYDLLGRKFFPKDGISPNVDPEEAMNQLVQIAQRSGLNDISEFKENKGYR